MPGTVPMLALAHRQHGRLPWARLFEPAIALAREGFTINRRLYRMLETIEKEMVVAPGYVQKVWTFGGTVPGSASIMKSGRKWRKKGIE